MTTLLLLTLPLQREGAKGLHFPCLSKGEAGGRDASGRPGVVGAERSPLRTPKLAAGWRRFPEHGQSADLHL